MIYLDVCGLIYECNLETQAIIATIMALIVCWRNSNNNDCDTKYVQYKALQFMVIVFEAIQQRCQKSVDRIYGKFPALAPEFSLYSCIL